MNTPEVEQKARPIPVLGYSLKEIFASIGSIAASVTSFLFICLLSLSLPLSVMSAMLLTKELREQRRPTRRVVLVTDAWRGMDIIMQYINEPGTVIIAASSSIDSVQKIVFQLGWRPAIIQCADLDLTAPKLQVVDMIKLLDLEYGPITHFYDVSGILGHLQDHDQGDRGTEATTDTTNSNIAGTLTAVITMYQLMITRGCGKICIADIGSFVGDTNLANTIYASAKSFVNTFPSSLRVLTAALWVDAVTIQPGFTGMPGPQEMATKMRNAMEKGSTGFVLCL